MLDYLIVVGIFVGAVICVGLVRQIARRFNWVAKPRADRWHVKPTALHGGVGFFIPFFIGTALLFYLLRANVPLSYGNDSLGKLFMGFLGGVGIMFLTGLLDDIYQFKPTSKLLLEVLATVIFIFSGGVARMTGYVAVDTAVTFLWFIGIINAVNLLDNMDGASSGVVMIGSLGVCVIGILGNYAHWPLSVWISGCLFASIFGFWLYNRPPASIFMGDSGSLFMGFAFAGITLPTDLNLRYGLVDGTALSLHPMLIAVTLAGIPILDTSLVTVTRLWRGQSPAVGGRDHSTHRLAHSGLTANQTIVVLYALATVCVLCAFAMQQAPHAALLVFCILLIGFIVTAFYLASVAVEVGETRGRAWQQLFNSILYRVPLIKIVVDVPLVILAFYASYMLRFDFHIPAEHEGPMYYGMLVAVICCLSANLSLGVYKFSWRSASGGDVVHYFACAMLGTILTLSAVALLTRFEGGHSRGAFVIFSLVYLVGLIGVRFSFRFIDEVLLKLRRAQKSKQKHNVVIFGAGREGALLYSHARDLPTFSEYRILGFVDESPALHGSTQGGLPVFSPGDLRQLDFGNDIPELWISTSRISDSDAIQLKKNLERDMIIRRLKISMEEIQH